MKNLALLAAMSATASAGEEDCYRSLFTKRFRCDKSTHMRMESLFFLGVTTMGAHQSVGSVTGAMICCCCNKSSSAANLSRYAKGMDLGEVMQNGLALADKWM